MAIRPAKSVSGRGERRRMTNLPLPDDHAAVLADLKRRVSQARYQAQRQVNTELIRLYRQIGKILAERTDRAAWGGKVIARLAADLRDAFPDSRGFSDRNLVYMRGFARGWPEFDAVAQQPAAQLPWGHLMVLTTACRHRRPVAVHRQERPGRSLFARNQQSAHGDRQLRPAGTCRAGRVAVRGRSHSGPRVTVSSVLSSAVESPPT